MSCCSSSGSVGNIEKVLSLGVAAGISLIAVDTSLHSVFSVIDCRAMMTCEER